MTTTRRSFLSSVAASTAATSLSGCAGLIRPRTGFIDAHVHVWTPDTAAYPVARGFSKAEVQPPSFTPSQLFDVCEPEGVDRVVLIQMSFYQFDNRYLLDAIRRHPGRFSGVAIVDHETPDLTATVKALKAQGIRGFRLYADRDKADAWQQSAGMKTLWTVAADEGLSMCLLANPDALPAIDRMSRAYPRTPVVIDHFARIGMRGPVNEADLDQLCRLATHPLTRVKTSAFYALGAKAPPYTDLAPLIHRLRDAYGAQRLMWASDCPFQIESPHTYAASISLIRDRLDFLSSDDKEWMLRKTAEKVFFS